MAAEELETQRMVSAVMVLAVEGEASKWLEGKENTQWRDGSEYMVGGGRKYTVKVGHSIQTQIKMAGRGKKIHCGGRSEYMVGGR